MIHLGTHVTIGMRVTVTSVRGLGLVCAPRKLLGRTGTVTAIDRGRIYSVSGLTRVECVTGPWQFTSEHLDVAREWD